MQKDNAGKKSVSRYTSFLVVDSTIKLLIYSITIRLFHVLELYYICSSRDDMSGGEFQSTTFFTAIGTIEHVPLSIIVPKNERIYKYSGMGREGGGGAMFHLCSV